VKSISTIEALKATDASSSRARKSGAFLTASSINPFPHFHYKLTPFSLTLGIVNRF
jgi:hypothetical protein